MEEEIKKYVPAFFQMIASSEDSQKSNEKFKTKGASGSRLDGGICTTSFLKTIYNDETGRVRDLTWKELVECMRKPLKELGERKGFHQTPILSSSRQMDLNQPLHIAHPTGTGTRRALLVGIKYTGQKDALRGSHNDVNNIKWFLTNCYGFQEQDMTILMDDGKHIHPTKKNIEKAMKRLTEQSTDGDTVFFHFSGHGSQIPDQDGDEEDGWDECLMPVDHAKNGIILDDYILRDFVQPMRKGVHCTVLVDCCHSGTVLDLPYVYGVGDETMKLDSGFDIWYMQRNHNYNNSTSKKETGQNDSSSSSRKPTGGSKDSTSGKKRSKPKGASKPKKDQATNVQTEPSSSSAKSKSRDTSKQPKSSARPSSAPKSKATTGRDANSTPTRADISPAEKRQSWMILWKTVASHNVVLFSRGLAVPSGAQSCWCRRT